MHFNIKVSNKYSNYVSLATYSKKSSWVKTDWNEEYLTLFSIISDLPRINISPCTVKSRQEIHWIVLK